MYSCQSFLDKGYRQVDVVIGPKPTNYTSGGLIGRINVNRYVSLQDLQKTPEYPINILV
jgi:hypothetical protein